MGACCLPPSFPKQPFGSPLYLQLLLHAPSARSALGVAWPKSFSMFCCHVWSFPAVLPLDIGRGVGGPWVGLGVLTSGTLGHGGLLIASVGWLCHFSCYSTEVINLTNEGGVRWVETPQHTALHCTVGSRVAVEFGSLQGRPERVGVSALVELAFGCLDQNSKILKIQN